MRLEDKICQELEKRDMSIPALSKMFDVDEFKLLHIIARLEDKGKIELKRFDRLYREDGGAIYLAIYGKKIEEI